MSHPPAGPGVSSGASVTNEAQAARSAEDNVRTYRFVKEFPAKTGVKSSQSGNPSHCFGAGASLRGPTRERGRLLTDAGRLGEDGDDRGDRLARVGSRGADRHLLPAARAELHDGEHALQVG